MDGEDELEEAKTSSPVGALAGLVMAQEDAAAALADGFEELEAIEKAIADELGVTVEELEVVEDSALGTIAPPPDGYEWGDTY